VCMKIAMEIIERKASFGECLKCLKLWNVLSARSILFLIGNSLVLALISNLDSEY